MSEPKEEPSEKAKPGPDPDHLQIDGDWGEAVKKALSKEKPEGGWPRNGDDA